MLFGTDGIRGTMNRYPMTPTMVLRFSIAVGLMLQQQKIDPNHKPRVIIAKDTRLSGYVIESALTSGLASVGINVTLVGPMPTPSVPMLIKSLRADFGIMITASHNPFHDNGLKLFDESGHKLSNEREEDLQKIITEYEAPQHEGLDHSLAQPNDLGRVTRLDDAHGRYIEYVKSCFPKKLTLEGMRVVIDCANGAAYRIAPSVFWELGADVITIGTTPNGININDSCGSIHPSALSAKVIETRSDIGIALDGDADRVLICDENGKIVHGDHLIGVIGKSLYDKKKIWGDGIVITHVCNSALDNFFEEINLKTYRTGVGDKYVSQEMRHRRCNFGGETSGHIILGDYSTTGDATIAALEVAALLKESKLPASQILYPFDLVPQATASIKIPYGTNPLTKQIIKDEIEAIKKENSDIKIIIRKSGTEDVIRIVIEGKNESKVDTLMHKIKETLLL